VQKLAGHSDVRLTRQTYAHVQAEALRSAVGVLDRMDREEKAVEDTPRKQWLFEGQKGRQHKMFMTGR
jgi:hypothetical protein